MISPQGKVVFAIRRAFAEHLGYEPHTRMVISWVAEIARDERLQCPPLLSPHAHQYGKQTDCPLFDTVNFWVERLLIEEKREAFRQALTPLVERKMQNEGRVWLDMDYDPDDTLLEAVHAVGIECDGFMFSGRGIFDRDKTRTRTTPERFVANHGMGIRALDWIYPVASELGQNLGSTNSADDQK